MMRKLIYFAGITVVFSCLGKILADCTNRCVETEWICTRLDVPGFIKVSNYTPALAESLWTNQQAFSGVPDSNRTGQYKTKIFEASTCPCDAVAAVDQKQEGSFYPIGTTPVDVLYNQWCNHCLY